MTDASPRQSLAGRPAGWTTGRAIAAFVGAGLLAMVFIAGVGLSIARRTADREAVRSAREVAQVDARHVSPVIDDALLRRDAAAIDALDRVVHERVLSDRLVRVKVWNAAGQIVYADDRSLIGRRFGLDGEELDALEHRTAEAGVSDLSKPENQGERGYRKLLEVYVGTRTLQGTPVLFESYLRYGSVTDDGNRLLSSFAPALLGGLVALFLVQVPLAVALTRRVKRSQEEQSLLLQQAIESSDRERRRIASDLHDSVVQGLAGSSYSLAALADETDREHHPALARHIRELSAELRQWVRELRTLIVNMVPPRLHDEGLTAALADLTSTLDARGVSTELHVDPEVRLSPTTEALLFRAAQEAVRNTISHADAHHVSVVVAAEGQDRVRLTVADDGRGFSPDDVADRRSEGHVGLQLLAALAAQSGGFLDVEASPGAGTTITLEAGPR